MRKFIISIAMLVSLICCTSDLKVNNIESMYLVYDYQDNIIILEKKVIPAYSENERVMLKLNHEEKSFTIILNDNSKIIKLLFKNAVGNLISVYNGKKAKCFYDNLQEHLADDKVFEIELLVN